MSTTATTAGDERNCTAPAPSSGPFFLQRLVAIKDRMPKWLQATIVAVSLVMAAFPDVIFVRASISFSGLSAGPQMLLKKVCIFPEPQHRIWQHAYFDTAGGVYQSEPMQHFMRFALWHRESPYWNPYSGCGQLGPETIVDLKFSFFTFLMSLIGGSQFAYHALTLSLFGLAVFFLFLSLNVYFRLSFLGSVSGCLVYLLNGYTMANLGSNTAQSYLYFPWLLFWLCACASKPSTARFAAVCAVNIIIWSTTFLPTTLLLLTSTYAIAAAYLFCLKREDKGRHFTLTLSALCAASITGFLALAFLYFPFLECTKVVNEISDYDSRTFYPANIASLLSLFSSKHFWDAYPYATPPVLFTGLPDNPAFKLTNCVYHFGIMPILLAASAVTLRNRFQSPIVLTLGSLVVISLGRIFGVFGICDFVGVLPGFKSFGAQYWFQVLAVAFPLIAAIGIDAIRQKKRFWWLPAIAVYSLLAFSLLYTFQNYGIREPRDYTFACVTFILLFIPVSAVLIFCAQKGSYAKQALACSLILFAMLVELTHDAIHYRYARTEIFKKPSLAIRFLQKNCGNYRVANLGDGLLPAEYGSAFQIQQIESLNMNVLPWYSSFFNNNFLKNSQKRWCVFPTMFCFADEKNPEINTDLLNALAVKYLVVSNYWPNYYKYLKGLGYKVVFLSTQWAILENPHVFPRIFAVSALNDGDLPASPHLLKAVAYSRDRKLINLARSAGIRSLDSSAQALETVSDAVELISYHHDNITAKVNFLRPELVILMDNWHPNWKAEIDGKSAYVGKVNSSFRGVLVPGGSHTVTMKYRPHSLPAAIAVSSLISCLLLLAVPFRNHLDRIATRLLAGAGGK